MTTKNNKYNARKTKFRGMVFDSRKEFKRFLYLQFLEKKGIISQLRRQVKFQIIPPLYVARAVNHAKTTRIKSSLIDSPAYYTCDFLYRENGRIIIEDVKSAETARLKDYILRRKLMIRIIARHNARRGHDTFEFRENGFSH